MKTFPDVPTIRELGYDFVNPAVYMFAASKGTPLSTVRKLDDAFRKAMDDPEFVRYMDQMELEITYRNHEDLKKYLEEAYRRMGEMAGELKIPKESETK
jgi:tripartite-type tricarboxylate transporter receptor subunit TctC